MMSGIRHSFYALFLSLCFTTQVFAEKPWVPFNYFKNSGGLNDGASDTEIDDDEASSGQNFVFTTSGNIQKRSGFAQINTVSATGIMTGLTFYKQSDGDKFIVGVTDDSLFLRMDYSGTNGNPDGIWDTIGSTTATVTQNDLADFAIAEDELVIEDGIGTTPPYKWTGGVSQTTVMSAAPNASMVAYHKLHLVLAGNSTALSRLYVSNLGDIDLWTATDTVDVETNDGSIIRDIESGLDALYIWKDKSIWRLSGTDRDNFVLEQMVDGIGTLSRKSVAKLNNYFLFITNQGDVAIYDGGINVKIISNRVQGSIDEASFTRFQFSPGLTFDEDYYLSYSPLAVGSHSRLLVYDSFHDAWTRFSGMPVNAMSVIEDSTGKEFLAFTGYDGNLNKYPVANSDFGSAIDFSWTSKNFKFPSLMQTGGGAEKIWRLLRVFAKGDGNSYNLNVETRSDFITSGSMTSFNLRGDVSLWDSAIWDEDTYGGATVVVGRTEPNLAKNFFQVKFSNVNASEPITVLGYEMWIQPTETL